MPQLDVDDETGENIDDVVTVCTPVMDRRSRYSLLKNRTYTLDRESSTTANLDNLTTSVNKN
ncbi:hypothetical protein [Chamaesiphon sp. VAR_48_metabat_135_sub]|uniref:hypothetical protein n=1 Tax=Chamaesiphon sp. VAR_48_metabat_135_sub TaxID=2964699 RepID=UPI00286D2A92|nr:hypothetical protein [Chamaesiphon sp. VAR_48_metabat_135_sub]